MAQVGLAEVVWQYGYWIFCARSQQHLVGGFRNSCIRPVKGTNRSCGDARQQISVRNVFQCACHKLGPHHASFDARLLPHLHADCHIGVRGSVRLGCCS